MVCKACGAACFHVVVRQAQGRQAQEPWLLNPRSADAPLTERLNLFMGIIFLLFTFYFLLLNAFSYWRARHPPHKK